MVNYNQDKIEEVQSQLESKQLSAEAEEEELAHVMSLRCLADELHAVDINGELIESLDLSEADAVQNSARTRAGSNEGYVVMVNSESMFVNSIIHESTRANTAANSSLALIGNSSSTPKTSRSRSTSSYKEEQDENETSKEDKNPPLIPKPTQLRQKYPHHFQMCEYYTAAASCAERLSRSNITILAHSQLLSHVMRAHQDQERKAVKAKESRVKEEKNHERERIRGERKEREMLKKIKEKWLADVMRLGHKCVLKRGILQSAHLEAWRLEREEEEEEEEGGSAKAEKMERVRGAWL